MGRILRMAFFSIVVVALLYGVMYLIWGGNNERQGAGFGLAVGVVLMGIAALAVLIASITNIVHHPKSGLSILIGIVLFAIIVLIGYSVSSGFT